MKHSKNKLRKIKKNQQIMNIYKIKIEYNEINTRDIFIFNRVKHQHNSYTMQFEVNRDFFKENILKAVIEHLPFYLNIKIYQKTTEGFKSIQHFKNKLEFEEWINNNHA